MIKIIKAGEARYLSELPEFQDGLPHGIVNKTKTDVGGTYVAANCQSNYIIVCLGLLRASQIIDSTESMTRSDDKTNAS